MMLVIRLAIFLLPLLLACGPKAANVTEFREKLDAVVDAAADFGLECSIKGTVGDGQFLGQSFNISGVHAAFELVGKPTRRVVDAGAILGPTANK